MTHKVPEKEWEAGGIREGGGGTGPGVVSEGVRIHSNQCMGRGLRVGLAVSPWRARVKQKNPHLNAARPNGGREGKSTRESGSS